MHPFISPMVADAVEVTSNTLGIVASSVGLVHMLVVLLRNALARREIPGVKPQIVLGRWLLLSLELTLAADVVATLTTPSWDEIGKLTAIIVLRTMLNYFLAKEIEQASQEPVARLGHVTPTSPAVEATARERAPGAP